jgi:LysR family transcriptional regulator of gallate degradation
MTSRNLRHMRLFLAVIRTGTLTQAAMAVNVSQPAATQAIAKLEGESGGALFARTPQGFFPTPRGTIFAGRVARAFALLDPALESLSPRLRLTATTAQLNALIAVYETESFTLAARRLGVSQPTVHRAVAQMEQEAGTQLFKRTSFGLVPSRATRTMVPAVMLAVRELDQAQGDLAEVDGMDAGQIVIGALPLSRSVLLPQTLVAFRKARPRHQVQVIDGRYDELLTSLRRGDVDFIIGALRQPAPIGDIVQDTVFHDRLTILAGRHHPLLAKPDVTMADLRAGHWVVPRRGTPSRDQFDLFFSNGPDPASLIEAGSILLMREILAHSNILGFISAAQAKAEIARGLVSEVTFRTEWPTRPIGLTYRRSWLPTKAQADLLALLRTAPGQTA